MRIDPYGLHSPQNEFDKPLYVPDWLAKLLTFGAAELPVVGTGADIVDFCEDPSLLTAAGFIPFAGSIVKKIPGSNSTDGFVDLASPDRRRHILDGDATGGGHRPGTGNPGKSEFPAGRSDDSIMHDISDVATDPASRTSPGRGGRTVTDGTRNGVDIQVIQESNGDIVTAYPTNTPRNPN